MPLTVPAVLMVATPVLVLLQVPPADASERETGVPIHTDNVPLIAPAAGDTFTETAAVAIVVPHELLTV